MQKQDNFENTIVLGIIFFSDKKYMKISTEIWNFQKKKVPNTRKLTGCQKKLSSYLYLYSEKI